MKNLIRRIEMAFIFLIMAVMISSTANAGFFPMPFSGRVEGSYVEGLIVQVTNVREGVSVATRTTSAGEWLIDWDRDYARTGDQFNIEILNCDKPSCMTSVTFNNEPEIFTVLKIYDVCICPPTGPETWTKIGAGIVIGLIAGLVMFMGGGIKLYKKMSGEIAKLHRHKGIKAYHDIDISHKNPKYRHARFKDNPTQFAKDVKKIQKEGGLI